MPHEQTAIEAAGLNASKLEDLRLRYLVAEGVGFGLTYSSPCTRFPSVRLQPLGHPSVPGTPLGRQPAKGATQYSKGPQVAMLAGRRAAGATLERRPSVAPCFVRTRPRGYILPDSRKSGRPGMNKFGARNQIKRRVVV